MRKNYSRLSFAAVVIGALRLTLKRQRKIAADDVLIFYIYLSKKIRLDFSCESLETSSLICSENNEKILMNVICRIRDWRLKVKFHAN